MKSVANRLFAIALLGASGAAVACDVGGRVTDASGRPVPGVKVSVANPASGRSQPAYTNAQGRYVLSGIPMCQQTYTLEVYWGSRPVYRRQIAPNGRDSTTVDVQLG